MIILDKLKAEIAEKQRWVALIESYREGDQWQITGCSIKSWTDCDGKPDWSFEYGYDYRKKPEPAVCYRNQYSIGWTRNAYASEREARKHASPQAIRVGVKFVEVPE
jgi:hypothetical protein